MRGSVGLTVVAVAMLAVPAAARAAFAHVVARGESLSSIAAVDGLGVDQLAAANGLSPDAELVAGSTLMIPPQTPTSYGSAATPVGAAAAAGDGDGDADDDAADGPAGSAASTQPVGAPAEGSPSAPPYPTAERVTASQIGELAATNGVPPSLADAVAYQESGFNNGEVSGSDARGVMQILPGTWHWIQGTLVPAGAPLNSASAVDNVRGGVLMLRALLDATGGDAALAAAGYYQGLPSVRAYGVLPGTQQYVDDVLALQQRFGGG
jgi:soluble lytic murein transglycosylase-like protein